LKDISGALEAAQRFNSGEGYVILASENIVLIMITTALFLIRNWYENEKYTHELEQKNTTSELTLLRAQLQPHFLFNNLNTIYFLMEKNPLLAKEMMIWSADVLSHQLYNARKDKVLLKEELDSLEKFLKIQRVRHEDFLDLKYSFPANAGISKIAPMILFTFVENAFKHGQRESGYSIDITLEVAEPNLYLKVINTIGDKREGNHGVGLENVKRRLALLYPGKHILRVEESTETYTVNLMISLDGNGEI
jgi:LytS/YehU family sensor histidine kinase